MRALRILIAVNALTVIVSVALSLDAVTILPGLGGVILGIVLLQPESGKKADSSRSVGKLMSPRSKRSAA